MRDIDARNLAAALTTLGADVESALLDLTANAPSLDAPVRKALFAHNELPTLRFIADRRSVGLHFIDRRMTREVCIMHATDLLTRYFDDSAIVNYLVSTFPTYNLENLCRTSQ